MPFLILLILFAFPLLLVTPSTSPLADVHGSTTIQHLDDDAHGAIYPQVGHFLDGAGEPCLQDMSIFMIFCSTIVSRLFRSHPVKSRFMFVISVEPR